MKNKRIINIFILVFFTVLLVGCGAEKMQYMDRPADDGQYHYQNKDLGFAIILPGEFQYYQTQRKTTDDYIDIEFFVPISDTDYPVDVSGYAKPLKARIFTAEDWDEILEGSEDGLLYRVAGQKGGRVYTLRFWDKIPEDWGKKWSESVEEEIIKSFKIL